LIRGTPQPTPEVIVRPSVIRAPPVRRPFTISYEVEVINHRTGKRVCVRGDLFTNNFVKFMQFLFSNIPAGSYIDVSDFVNYDGTAKTLRAGTNEYDWEYCSGRPREWYIATGKGTDTPSVNDYDLFDRVQLCVLTYRSATVSSTEATVELKAGATATTTYDITEVGLMLYCCDDVGAAAYILLTHDMLSEALHVDEGDGFTAMYRFRFTW